MIVRICPMCDCEMKKSHYCDTCHTWIWKPQMLDVHFNSSTRGLGEPDCAYGEEHDAFHHAVQDRDRFFQERFGQQQHDVQSDDVTSRKVRAAGRRQAQREQAARQREKAVQQRQLQAERYKEKRGKSSGNPKLGIIIFIIVIIYIIIGSMMSVVDMF